MVVGYDVHHNKGSNSTVGFTATTDRNFCRYWSRAHTQGNMQEFSSKLQNAMEGALEAFSNSNGGTYPQ